MNSKIGLWFQGYPPEQIKKNCILVNIIIIYLYGFSLLLWLGFEKFKHKGSRNSLALLSLKCTRLYHMAPHFSHLCWLCHHNFSSLKIKQNNYSNKYLIFYSSQRYIDRTPHGSKNKSNNLKKIFSIEVSFTLLIVFHSGQQQYRKFDS